MAFLQKIPGVRLCWVLEKPQGPEGLFTLVTSFSLKLSDTRVCEPGIRVRRLPNERSLTRS
jgi:hypothetical protein